MFEEYKKTVKCQCCQHTNTLDQLGNCHERFIECELCQEFIRNPYFASEKKSSYVG